MAFDADPSAAGVGRIPVRTAHGTFEVWTRRSGTSPTIKLLLLDGGPGCTRETFEVFDSVLPQAGIEILLAGPAGFSSQQQARSSRSLKDRSVC